MSYKNQYTRTRWRTAGGVNTSVGLPSYLFNLLVIRLGTKEKVREWLVNRAGSFTGSTSTRSHWLEQQAVLMLLGVVTC